MKIVIVGNGKVGFTIAKALTQEGHDITVIDNKPVALKNTMNVLDVTGVDGNGASLDILQEANVDEADIVIATTSTDEMNITCCLIAKKLGAKATIARIRNPEYLSSMHLIKDELGLSMYINPEKEAAMEIARTLNFSDAIKVNTFAKGRLTLAEIKLGPKCPIIGMTLSNIYLSYRINVLVCTILRNNDVIIPNGNTILQDGDKISITGTNHDLRNFFKRIGFVNNPLLHIMIAGGGKIAYYLAKELLQMGCEITIIEQNKVRAGFLLEDFDNQVNVLNGDATDQELLLSEGLKQQDAFIALTGNDEENVIMSMYATSLGVKKVIPKVNRMQLGFVLEKLGLDSTITPKNICADQIIEYVRAMQNSVESSIESMIHLLDNRVEVLEFRVKKSCKFTDIALKDVNLKSGILVASITHNGKTSLANGNSKIQVGDSVLIISKVKGLGELNDVYQY